MYLKPIEDVPHTEKRAVIINCGTKEVTTLALLSTLRHTEMPVILIDCDSKDGSLEFFVDIMRRFRYPLCPVARTWSYSRLAFPDD